MSRQQSFSEIYIMDLSQCKIRNSIYKPIVIMITVMMIIVAAGCFKPIRIERRYRGNVRRTLRQLKMKFYYR